MLAILLAIIGGYRFRQSGLGFRNLKSMLQNAVQGRLAGVMPAAKSS